LEVVFFIGFTVMVVTQLCERTRSPRYSGRDPGRQPAQGQLG
jgi:hypothetical protein